MVRWKEMRNSPDKEIAPLSLMEKFLAVVVGFAFLIVAIIGLEVS